MSNHADSEDYHSEMGKLKGAEIDSHRLPPLQSVNQPPEDTSHEVPNIYSLGEFQTSLSRSNKESGSMSMDDYFDSIFTAKENQSEEGMILSNQPIFPRQVPLNIPQPLYCETMEEVCDELQNDNFGIHELLQNTNTVQNPKSFRAMTLQDFLDKAGLKMDPQQQLIGFSQNYDHLDTEPNFPRVPVMATGGCVNISSPNHGLQAGNYPQTAPGNGNGNGKRKGRGPQKNQILSVADRRHKRLLMNRASATRSRERKQAYTVDLEEELAFLREENERLSQALAELEGGKQLQMQHGEEEAARATANMKTKSDKVNEKLKAMRRSYSCTAEATCIKWRLMPT